MEAEHRAWWGRGDVEQPPPPPQVPGACGEGSRVPCTCLAGREPGHGPLGRAGERKGPDPAPTCERCLRLAACAPRGARSSQELGTAADPALPPWAVGQLGWGQTGRKVSGDMVLSATAMERGRKAVGRGGGRAAEGRLKGARRDRAPGAPVRAGIAVPGVPSSGSAPSRAGTAKPRGCRTSWGVGEDSGILVTITGAGTAQRSKPRHRGLGFFPIALHEICVFPAGSPWVLDPPGAGGCRPLWPPNPRR